MKFTKDKKKVSLFILALLVWRRIKANWRNSQLHSFITLHERNIYVVLKRSKLRNSTSHTFSNFPLFLNIWSRKSYQPTLSKWIDVHFILCSFHLFFFHTGGWYFLVITLAKVKNNRYQINLQKVHV